MFDVYVNVQVDEVIIILYATYMYIKHTISQKGHSPDDDNICNLITSGESLSVKLY